MDADWIRKVENQRFFTWTVESAFEKTLLEAHIKDITLSEAEQTRIRCAITIGVAETLMKLKELVKLGLEEGE